MKQRLLLLPLCAFLALHACAALGQSEQRPASADEILRRALAARGGEAAIARIRSYHCKGTVDTAEGNRCNFESFAARPNQSHTIYDFGGGSRFEAGFDGEIAWNRNLSQAAEKLHGEELNESKDAADWFGCYDDPRAYRSIQYVGETIFEGRKCYQLRMVNGSGREETNYYNATNFLLAGVLERAIIDSNLVPLTTSFTDYGKFSGFLFPTRYRCRSDWLECVVRIKSVEVNCVDASTFKMPEPPVSGAPSKVAELPANLSDAEIKTILRDYIDDDKRGEGLAVGLVDSSGARVICCGRTGNQKSPEVNGDTLFEIGSITKVFTRFLLQEMVEEGKMNLDDPLAKYLPFWARVPSRHGQQITLWDLTTHTSGLPRDIWPPFTVWHGYEFLALHQLRRDPGEQWEYSNLGMSLLGLAITRTAGKSYDALLRERIAGPLEMDSTKVKLTPEMRARRARPYSAPGHRTIHIPLKQVPGAGGIESTANDMVKFAAATLGLTPCPQTPLLRKTDVGHTGGTFGFSSGLAYDFDKRRALVVLSNCRDDSIIDRLSVLLKGCSPRPSDTIAVSSNLAARCCGQYYAKDRGIRTVWRQGGRLMLQEWGKPRCEIFPQSETNFYNQLFDCRAAFIRASNSPGVNELVIGDPVKPTWRGVKILGSSSPFTEDDCQPRKDSDLQGVWQATLRPSWYWPFYALHPKLKMAELSPGAFRAELETIDKRPSHLPLTVAYHPPSVDISMLPFEATFHGKMNPACTQVTGYWKENGHTTHITFRRVTPPQPQN